MITENHNQSTAATEGCAPTDGYATEHAWTPSHREEVISALWFIVAGVAHVGGCSPWVFWCIIAKATFDSIQSVICAVREWWREDAHTDRQGSGNREPQAMKNTTNSLERLPASAGSPTNVPKVWCKCEVCGWLEEFPAVNLNMEHCTIEFCEDCNLARVFDLA